MKIISPVIDPKTDFFSFRAQLAREYGTCLEDLSALFFERAIEEYNKGLYASSLDTARLALQLAEYGGDYVKVYIMGFLAQIYSEKQEYDLAGKLCANLLSQLNPAHKDFEEDIQYYTQLAGHITTHSCAA